MSKTPGKIIKEPSPPSTNKVILDYLLYLSIQSRLKKDKIRPSLLDDDDRAVESIVAGILATSHASNEEDTHTFQERLHLCQLTHTIGRTRRLMDAIPWFLKTSADLVRRTLDLDVSSSSSSISILFFAGEKDMAGNNSNSAAVGMPSWWYDLFLSLLTQAVLQSSRRRKESIVEIFSYGMVHDDDDDDDDCYYDEEDDDNEDVKAADYHLLFPRTRTMLEFKAQFLDGQHSIETLKNRYPLNAFQNDMRDFIQMAFKSMDEPVLDKYDGPTCNGSLLIPGDVDEPQSSHTKTIVTSSFLEAAAVTAIASASGSPFKRACDDYEDLELSQKKAKH